MRLRSDPSREPKLVKWICLEVGLDRIVINHAIVVVCGEGLAGGRIDQVGVGHVPLPDVLGVIPAAAQPVAKGWHFTRAQPAHPGVVFHLSKPVCLGHTVDVGILPGEKGWPARYTRERPRVVAPERHPIVLKPLCAAELLAPPRCHIGRLVRWRGPFLVGHEGNNVRSLTVWLGHTATSSRWRLSPRSISRDALAKPLPTTRPTSR